MKNLTAALVSILNLFYLCLSNNENTYSFQLKKLSVLAIKDRIIIEDLTID